LFSPYEEGTLSMRFKSRRGTCHLAALFGATIARIRAMLAMVNLVLAAFGAACLANLCTDSA
jgi:hypothetical protein